MKSRITKVRTGFCGPHGFPRNNHASRAYFTGNPSRTEELSQSSEKTVTFAQERFVLPYLILFLALLSSASAQPTPNQQKYVIDAVKIHGDIVLTGKLTDPKWNSAPTVECPFEIDPGDNTPARQRTWVKILYSSRALYVGFICEDTDAASIRAHVSDRDNIFQDDFMFVGIDPYRDNQRAYEFVVNPLGIQGDLMRTSNNEDPSWDAVWYSRGAISDTGYTAEIEIPFKSIRFPNAERQDWSIMLIRNWPRESRYQNSWTPNDRNNPCSICISGTLKGLTGIQSEGTVEILPYAMGYQSGNLKDPGDPHSGFVNGKPQGRIGGGLRYDPNPALSFQAVANPDFSQVESDATQISVNTTFAIFYPEKRPFFLDGAELYRTQINSFYSRMINNPLGAAKVIQKAEHVTLTYLAAEDRNTPFIVPGEEGSAFVGSSLRSFSNVLRAKYDFGTQSFLGFLGTTRNLSHGHNYAGGVDWNLFFGGNNTFLGQVLLTATREVNDTSIFDDTGRYGSTGRTKAFDGEAFGGSGLYAQFRHDARNYSYWISYEDFSPTFQAQDGFVTGNDLRTGMLNQEYTFYPSDSFITQGDVSLEGGMHFNYDNSRKERWGIAGLKLNMKSQTNVQLNYLLYNEELFRNVRFWKINRGEVQISSAPISALEISADLQLGRFIHRVDNPTLGTGHVISVTFTVKPTSRLEVDLSYSRSRLSDAQTGELFFDGYISRATAIYQFTGDLFVRLIGQYDAFSRRIELDPLISYKLNPFTIFYAGSTSSLTDFGAGEGIRETGRQFFLKLQYLWRQ